MSLLRSLFLPFASSGDGSVSPFDVFSGSLLMKRTASGEYVSPKRALQLSTYFACVRAVSEDVGKLPFKVFRRTDGGKTAEPSHSLYRLLHDAPNPETTPMAFRATLTGWAQQWGNAYAHIERDRLGTPVALWPIHPDNAVLQRFEGDLYLDVVSDGSASRIPYDDVFHLVGFGDNALCGLSVASLAAESLGVSLAAQTYGAAFFGNGATPSIVLTHPGKLNEVAQTNMRESWKKRHSGAKNSNGVAVLQEGVKVERLSVPPEEAQFLETRQFQIAEIARWFRMPPHKVGDLSRSTNNNIEHQSIEYVVDTLMPWLVRWEQECTRKLMNERERATLVAEHVVDGLLRGDATSRVNYYARMIQIGAMSPDEVRASENRNAIPGGLGAKFYMQGAMVPLERINTQPVPSSTVSPPADASGQPDSKSSFAFFYDAAGRVISMDETQ